MSVEHADDTGVRFGNNICLKKIESNAWGTQQILYY